MRLNRVLALGATMLVAFAACTSGGGATASPTTAPTTAVTPAPSTATTPAPSASASAAAKADIRIGSDNFYESKLAAELYAEALEAAGYKVTRTFGLGSRQDRAPAFENGQVDLVPEYVGSGLGYYDKTKITGDGEKNRAALQAVFDGKSKLATVLEISPGQDSNAFVVRQDTATSLNLSKMSDLAAVQDQLKWGLPPDCDANPLCKGALVQYGITYPPKQRQALAACDSPIARALKAKAIDLAELCSTQPAIVQFGFVQLTDDLGTQPAENIAPIVRNDYLAKVDATAFAAILDPVSAKLTTAELTKLGVSIAVDQKDIADVAKAWLKEQGLVQ